MGRSVPPPTVVTGGGGGVIGDDVPPAPHDVALADVVSIDDERLLPPPLFPVIALDGAIWRGSGWFGGARRLLVWA